MPDTLEVRLLSWSDGSRAGQTVTFLLTGEHEVNPFKGLRYGKTGERFAIALAKIEDDETKADHVFPEGYTEGSKPDEPEREKTDGEKAVIRAAMLCNDTFFFRWASDNWQYPGRPRSPNELSAQFIRDRCGMSSRRELATNPEALQKFLGLEADFRYRDTRR